LNEIPAAKMILVEKGSTVKMVITNPEKFLNEEEKITADDMKVSFVLKDRHSFIFKKSRLKSIAIPG
jgi:hypothetical protein